MGLRFFCVTGWGWVAGMGGFIAGCAHPFEKSVPSFTDASIHRLSPSTDACVYIMSGTCHQEHSQTTSFSAQLSHSDLGFLRVALGWRYDPHHEFPLSVLAF
jgi:hypothetical protein